MVGSQMALKCLPEPKLKLTLRWAGITVCAMDLVNKTLIDACSRALVVTHWLDLRQLSHTSGQTLVALPEISFAAVERPLGTSSRAAELA
jgi:hypothetical protein